MMSASDADQDRTLTSRLARFAPGLPTLLGHLPRDR
jgi:hypothetical protein